MVIDHSAQSFSKGIRRSSDILQKDEVEEDHHSLVVQTGRLTDREHMPYIHLMNAGRRRNFRATRTENERRQSLAVGISTGVILER